MGSQGILGALMGSSVLIVVIIVFVRALFALLDPVYGIGEHHLAKEHHVVRAGTLVLPEVLKVLGQWFRPGDDLFGTMTHGTSCLVVFGAGTWEGTGWDCLGPQESLKASLGLSSSQDP